LSLLNAGRINDQIQFYSPSSYPIATFVNMPEDGNSISEKSIEEGDQVYGTRRVADRYEEQHLLFSLGLTQILAGITLIGAILIVSSAA
jgi:hypothetical protein